MFSSHIIYCNVYSQPNEALFLLGYTVCSAHIVSCQTAFYALFDVANFLLYKYSTVHSDLELNISNFLMGECHTIFTLFFMTQPCWATSLHIKFFLQMV